ncbi:MAG: ornithine carbamoyltransferase [Spirochaetaceae bacterium]|nr:MAG: ornithine carbamoyltransferase [Spirochaetaceae bacterium]
MAFNLKGRSLLTLKDYSPEEITFLLELSHQVKRERRAGNLTQRFLGKTLALLFEKRSTRTRCAFETAFGEEGGHPVFLSSSDIQLGAKESIEDTARVLGRMFDAIQFRGFKQEMVEALAEYSGVPVYNGLTDLYHPTQILADLMTVQEVFGRLKGIKLVYAGDGRNNVARSLLIGCTKLGTDYTVIAPETLQPDRETVALCREYAKQSGSKIEVTTDVAKGVKDANVLYTDVWVSMGEEEKSKERLEMLRPYQVDEKMMAATGKNDTIFMHCLPAVKGNEVTFEVIESTASKVWDEAENRKHTIKAVMLATI